MEELIITEETIEHCWFVYGVRFFGHFVGVRIYHNKGDAASVEFDWKKAMSPFVLGWHHNHPSNYGVTPSETDNSTMRGWVIAMARPYLCGISCNDHFAWYKYFRASDRKIFSRGIKVYMLKNFVWGKL